MSKALIIYGGWIGHDPLNTALYMKQLLKQEKYQVVLSDSLLVLDDLEYLKEYDLIIMHWTRGILDKDKYENIQQVVSEGVGLAGIHGGLISAFQNNKKWLWLTGGCFVSHPGGINQEYVVNITDKKHPVSSQISDFKVKTEQYYVIVDQAIQVLATSDFESSNQQSSKNQLIKIPIAWIRNWGKGKVFYQSIGHDLTTLKIESVSKLTIEGFKFVTRKNK